ncbi:hypothetical protein LNV08_07010 [Paucibacter sp. TC2R-5]|uniref:hypothetical protein n=1 Tax=Paucibacter sp. TC2R-5 TaxID=2893555 RepID=UPI0021E3C821|nr:hypothetical protein [Paucibacter sp. TC2R-5]MCV2358725.1 hypothetical protein [Paucibacter sp. TC2R-5]
MPERLKTQQRKRQPNDQPKLRPDLLMWAESAETGGLIHASADYQRQSSQLEESAKFGLRASRLGRL